MTLGGLILYGPDKLRSVFKEDENVKKSLPLGTDPEKFERIANMKVYAYKCRKERALKRINQAIEDEDPDVLERLSEFEDIKK